MINRTTKLRWRRRIREQRRQVEEIGSQAERQLERHFFRRLNRLGDVRRFIFGWIFLLVLLCGLVLVQTYNLGSFYQKTGPVPGGIYTEGILGAYTNASPLYATGAVDLSVSKLLFNGLFKFDQSNRLVDDLATKWTVDDKGLVYTVTLREDVKWHDGTPFTAKDVVFTYATIQNPDAKSPLLSSWQGVKVEAQNDYSVVFTLPNTLSSFPYSMTNGIVPSHKLSGISAGQLRSDAFNAIAPVGTGPFKFDSIDVKGETQDDREEQITLVTNSQYHKGTPKLQKFVIRAFRSDKKLLESFEDKQLTAISGIETVPDSFGLLGSIEEFNIPFTAAVMTFFKTSGPILKDQKIRQALVQATNRVEIITDLQYPAKAVNGPLLTSHTGYNKDIIQLASDIEAAKKLLDENGWKVGTDGIRTKDNVRLKFTLVSQSTPEYAGVASALQKQWREVGVEVETIMKSADDMQVIIAQHSYDALLYGISLGVDPDVFAFWHSSQATPGLGSWLNFSEYKSGVADKALEAGRTRDDVQLRAAKYKSFLEAWRADAPAVSLYQPNYYYATIGKVYGLNPLMVNNATDRYANVENWMIRQAKVAL